MIVPERHNGCLIGSACWSSWAQDLPPRLERYQITLFGGKSIHVLPSERKRNKHNHVSNETNTTCIGKSCPQDQRCPICVKRSSFQWTNLGIDSFLAVLSFPWLEIVFPPLPSFQRSELVQKLSSGESFMFRIKGRGSEHALQSFSHEKVIQGKALVGEPLPGLSPKRSRLSSFG